MQHRYKRGPSPNFTWHEVNPHMFPGLGPKLRYNAIMQARKLEVLRNRINKRRKEHGLPPTGIRILSWWRPEWYNRQIHGARYSQHIKARATDISLQEINRLMPWKGGHAEFDALCAEIWKKGGFGTYPAGDRHTDNRGYFARWSSFVGT